MTSSPSIGQLCGSYVERRIEQVRLQQHWRPRIEGALWRFGHLSSDDQLTLQADPGLVKTIYPHSRGDIDAMLPNLMAMLKSQREGTFDQLCHMAFKYDTLDRDLPELQSHQELPPTKASVVAKAALEFDRTDIVLKLLPGLPESERKELLRQAFAHKRFAVVDVLVSEPYYLKPDLSMVLHGGRMDDLVEFGLEKELGQADLICEYGLSLTSPSLFNFWYEHTKDNFLPDDLQDLLQDLLAWAILNPNVELLEFLESHYPEVTVVLVANIMDGYVESARDETLHLSKLIETGNERLIGMVFRCLNRYQTQ